VVGNDKDWHGAGRGGMEQRATTSNGKQQKAVMHSNKMQQ
jgi:hypothetical protein